VTNLRRLAFAVLATAAMLGCYSPSIKSGGFSCGDGSACPDKFRCAADNRCYPVDKDASLDLPVDMPMVCTSMTSTTPVSGCSGGAVGGACNPACQTGCSCGWCAVAGGASKCLIGSAGSNDVGELCDPASSTSCKAGLYCQPECGDTTGRCYRYCPDINDTTVCGSGSKCNVALRKFGGGPSAATFLLCSLVSTCTVVPQGNCPGGFACYPFGATQTECDCQGTAATGVSCTATSQCQPGDQCVGPPNATSCYQACNTSTDCMTGTTCVPPSSLGTLYGYCM
jgi:hypothetical protein